MDKMKTMATSYWTIGVIAILLIGSVWFMTNTISKTDEMRINIADVNELIKDAKEKQKRIDESYDSEEHAETIESVTVSAHQIGDEIISVDNTLTAFYKSIEPMTTDKKILAKVATAEALNSKLTHAIDGEHALTWQLNPEWTLQLDSVITYGDVDEIPVLFSMHTKAKDKAGFVYAQYNVEEHTLESIVKYYMNDGMLDAIDIGGE